MGTVILRNRFDDGKLVQIAGDMSPGERTVWLLRKSVKAFDRYVDAHRLSVSFWTITQSDRKLVDSCTWITGLLDVMRKVFKRAGSDFQYLAVLEIQEKRYKKFGVLAPHWHVVVAYSAPGMMPSARRLQNGRIQKVHDGSVITWSWLFKNVKQKFGMYFICDAYSTRVYGYLSKYIAKGSDLDEFRAALGKRIKVFSHSRIPVEFQMSDGQAGEYHALVDDEPGFLELFRRREGSAIVFRTKEIVEHGWDSGFVYRCVKYPLVHSIKSDWEVVHFSSAPE